jgi:DNA-binding NarL/FixJ family response regulator
MTRLLILDEDTALTAQLAFALPASFVVNSCAMPEDASAAIRQSKPDVLICSQTMNFASEARRYNRAVRVIVLTDGSVKKMGCGPGPRPKADYVFPRNIDLLKIVEACQS